MNGKRKKFKILEIYCQNFPQKCCYEINLQSLIQEIYVKLWPLVTLNPSCWEYNHEQDGHGFLLHET